MPYSTPLIIPDYTPYHYSDLLESVMASPSSYVTVRDMNTIERMTTMIRTPFSRIRERIHFNRGRWENPIFGYVEGLFILLGIDKVEPYAWYAPKMAQYVDDNKDFFHGAYGPRLGTQNIWLGELYTKHDEEDFAISRHFLSINQLEKVYQKLKKDPTTRQAVMTIWEPGIDNDSHKDIPCTIMFHFLLRDNYLHLNVYMRSQDLLTGFVYDTQQFKWFQEIMAGWLSKDLGSISLGDYTHILGSAHIYEKDIDTARIIMEGSSERNYLYSHYHSYDCKLEFKKWKKTMKILAKVEYRSRKGDVFDAENLIINQDWYDDSNIFYYEMATAILAINMAKHGHTKDALRVSERLLGELTIPTLCRLYAYHAQLGNPVKIKERLHPDMKSLVENFVIDKTGKLKMVG